MKYLNRRYDPLRGTFGGTQYRNTVRKNGKYRNTDTLYFNHIYNRFRIVMELEKLSQAFMHQMSMFFFNILVVRQFFLQIFTVFRRKQSLGAAVPR